MGEEVNTAVDGTVVDWEKKVQRNPKTGDEYDFDGKPVTKEKDKRGPKARNLPE